MHVAACCGPPYPTRQLLAQPSIMCPRCGMESFNPNDIEQGYCGHCCWWTSHPQLRSIIECPAEGCHFLAPDDDLAMQAAHMTKMHPDIVTARRAESEQWAGWEDG